MNSLKQKLQLVSKHKKAISNFQHLNYHYPSQKEPNKEQRQTKNIHKKAKSFSKQYIKSVGQLDSYHDSKLCYKNQNQFYSQVIKQQKPSKNLYKIRQECQAVHEINAKSQSQSKRNKKKFKLEIKPSKSSPDKSLSKSKKKLLKLQQKHNLIKHDLIKQQKICKLKNQYLKKQQRKHKSKQIPRQINNSKDSKKSSSKQSQKNKKVSQNKHISEGQKIQQRRQLQNILKKQKKGVQINFKNISLKKRFQQLCEEFPLSIQEIKSKYQGNFTQNQINEMEEFKEIYFLGKNFNINKYKLASDGENGIKSARQRVCEQLQNQQQDYIRTIQQKQKYHYYDTEQHNINHAQHDEQTHRFYKYKIGDHIGYRYQILNSINRGSFGQVLKVFDHKTHQNVAIKIVKNSKQLVQQTFIQISILTHIKQNDKCNTSGIVRIKDFLLFRNHICIVFQLLDGNLYELLTANSFKGFSEDILRVFSVQILNSLNFLKREKIIHCDLKPENLVMKSWGKTGLKLIDFGTSCFQGKQMYSYLQSRYYRAPQVLMQMPYSFPIDMWSFGCILAQLKMGQPLFSSRSSIQQLIYICSSIGLPNKNDGLFSLAYLQNDLMKEIIQKDYLQLNNKQISMNLGQSPFQCKYQRALKKSCLQKLQDRIFKKGNNNPLFLNFLSSILVWQPQKRLSPQQALRHPWITKGLPQQIYSLYSNWSTSQNHSKQKKNSKDSKHSNQSRAKSSKQSKKVAHNKIGYKKQEIEKYRQNRDKNQENKINYNMNSKMNSLQDPNLFCSKQLVVGQYSENNYHQNSRNLRQLHQDSNRFSCTHANCLR